MYARTHTRTHARTHTHTQTNILKNNNNNNNNYNNNNIVKTVSTIGRQKGKKERSGRTLRGGGGGVEGRGVRWDRHYNINI